MNTKRSCGVLLPLFSLPSEHGIGTLGKAAYDFIDFLAAAGQSWWQLLPVGPAGSGDSPYNSFSSFAGNAYCIDLDMLVQDGLLTKAEVSAVDWGNDEQSVAYEKLRAHRMLLLRKAARRGLGKDAAEFDSFCRDMRFIWRSRSISAALRGRNGRRISACTERRPWKNTAQSLRPTCAFIHMFSIFSIASGTLCASMRVKTASA